MDFHGVNSLFYRSSVQVTLESLRLSTTTEPGKLSSISLAGWTRWDDCVWILETRLHKAQCFSYHLCDRHVLHILLLMWRLTKIRSWYFTKNVIPYPVLFKNSLKKYFLTCCAVTKFNSVFPSLFFSVAWSVHVLIFSSRTWRSGRTTCCPPDCSGKSIFSSSVVWKTMKDNIGVWNSASFL